MAALITAIPVTAAVQVTAEMVAVQVTAVQVTAVPVMVGLETAAKAAVQVVAAARVIPVEINPVAVVRAMPQSHQRNSLL